jgi:branched-chain amino acid transport system substrate-binding protein
MNSLSISYDGATPTPALPTRGREKVCGFKLPIAAFVALLTPFMSSAQAEILIGVAGPMSGQNAGFGEQMKRGAQAAVDQINQDGGINGEQLALVSADDSCDARRAVAVAQDFISQDVRFVVGHFCSGAAQAAAETYAKADIVMVAPSASNPKLTDENHWNVLRLAARDDAQADAALARITADVPSAKIAVVTDGTPGMAALIGKFSGAAAITIKPGEKSFPDAVEAIRVSGANVVYLACAGAEGGILAGQIQDAGLTPKLYGPDSLLSDIFWERAGIAGEGTLATFARDPAASPKAQSLIAFLGAAGIAPDGATLPAYAAVQVFAAAAKAKTVNDGKAMAQWLKSGVAVDTVLGAVIFNSKGDVVPPRLDWYRWSLGSYSRDTQLN